MKLAHQPAEEVRSVQSREFGRHGNFFQRLPFHRLDPDVHRFALVILAGSEQAASHDRAFLSVSTCMVRFAFTCTLLRNVYTFPPP